MPKGMRVCRCFAGRLYVLMMFYQLTQIIIDSIYAGTGIMVPCVFIIYLFKLKVPIIGSIAFIRALNCAILLASLFSITKMLITVCISFFSPSQYGPFGFLIWAFGPYWWAFWMLILVYAALPQLLWIKRCQKTIFSAAVFVILDFAVTIVKQSLPYRFIPIVSTTMWLIQALIYVAVLFGFYFIFKKHDVKASGASA